MWLLREISLPHLAQHRVRTALTILGISLGVAAIVATSAVTDAVFRGFRRTVEATAGRADLVLTNGGVGVAETAVEVVRSTPGVAASSPLIEGFVALAAERGDTLAVFGMDVLGDGEHDNQLPRGAIEIDDVALFVSQADSVVIPKSFSQTHGLARGSSFKVVGPSGERVLTVRGLVDPVGPATLFGGRIVLMDLPAAQRLLGKEGKVDRVDIRLGEGAERAETVRALTERLRGVGRIEENAVHGAKAESLLFALRVTLGIAGLLAAIVAVFLIYHTVAVSIGQRRGQVAILNALGVARRTLLIWLLVEALLIGFTACAFGTVVGFALAHLAAAVFGTVTSAWVVLQPETPVLATGTIVIAVMTATITSLAATLVPAWNVVWHPLGRTLRGEARSEPTRRTILRSLVSCTLGLLACVLALVVAPRTLGYHSLVGYIFAVNSLALISIAWLAPAAAYLAGHLARLAANRGKGLALMLASGATTRNPMAPAAVIAAMVVGLGWNLANGAVIRSFQTSFLDWLDDYYRSDLIVSAGGSVASLLTLPPIDDDVLPEIGALAAVEAVQGLRLVAASYLGQPVVLQAMDRVDDGLPLVDGEWDDVAPALWSGDGVLISENLAYKTGLGRGAVLALDSPSGEQQLRILGTFVDFGGGDLGSITIGRDRYRVLWRDGAVSRIRIWLKPAVDVESARREIQRRVGARGLTVVTAAEFRIAARELYVDNAFAINYALVLIAAVISFVAVANFFVSTVLDRAPQLAVLRAVGASQWQLRVALLVEGALLGAVGVLLGLAAGALASRIIVVHSVPMVTGWRLQYVFPTSAALEAALGTLLLAALAGWIPRTRTTAAARGISE